MTEPTQESTQGSTQTPNVNEYASKKIAAGICGILIGWLGIHKFILGMTTPGIIMVLVTVLSCFILSPVMSIIGLIEDGTIDTAPWITHQVTFDEIPERFDSLIRPETGVLKAIIEVTD